MHITLKANETVGIFPKVVIATGIAVLLLAKVAMFFGIVFVAVHFIRKIW